MNDKILLMAGMARRMRKSSSGSFITEKNVRNGSSKLVILSCDAAENTKKSVKILCEAKGVPCIEYSDMLALGKAVGTEARAVVSIEDDGIAAAILKLYNDRFSE